MNYYIQGNKEKAEEIKAAFEKLGYRSAYVFNAEMTLYFTFNGEIKTAIANSYKSIIKTHPDYKELELPVKPKFKVGNWIVGNDGVFKITQYEDEHGYNLTDAVGGVVHFISPDYVESNFRLWTIQDAKDGDVLVTTTIRNCPFIYRKTSYKNNLAYYYVGIDGNGDLSHAYHKNTLCHFGPASDVVPATKEQRDLLFAKIKDAGCEWDAEKKELKKIKHYDISSFYAGMPVLERSGNDEHWDYNIFSRYLDNNCSHPFILVGCHSRQCIPFDGNEHLLGTTDPCSEEFVNW